MKKLAIVTTHPIQYYAPVFRLLGNDPRISVRVFYTWGEQSIKKHDPGFERTVEWDIPLLDGYDYAFVQNTSPEPGSHHFQGIRNPRLIDEIESFGPDAILVYGWAWASHLKALRYFHGKKPVWFRGDSTLLGKEGGLKGWLRNKFLQWVYHFVDKAFYAGTENKRYFLQQGLTETELEFCPHAVDNARFAEDRSAETSAFKASAGIPGEATVVLFAGKLDQNKNITLLLDAFRKLDRPDAHLVIAGDGPLRSPLSETPEERVHFLGFVNQSVMPLVYQCCDLFCLPSLSETWGLAVNEAMAAGKAVMVSDKVGCAPDLVKENVNGRIFCLDERPMLAEVLNDMLADKQALRQMGQVSRKLIAEYNFAQQAKVITDQLLLL